MPGTRMRHRRPRGSALILSIMFIGIFSAMAVAMATVSGVNTQAARNQRSANRALASAESGMEIMQYWLTRVCIPNGTSSGRTLSTVATNLAADLAARDVSNVAVTASGSTILIPAVPIQSQSGQSFAAAIRQIDNNTLQMDVTGNCGAIARTIRLNFPLVGKANPIFDYGLATKGPLRLSGNVTSQGVNSLSEADIYIGSSEDNLALEVSGDAIFDGSITIGNPSASVYFDGDIEISGDSSRHAIDDHVSFGEHTVDFPVPDTDHFQQYATGNSITSSSNTSDDMPLTNARIVAGTNPCFDGNIQVKGVLFIEAPNTVEFKGNVNIEGLIVADGDIDNPRSNSMTFEGNFDSGPLPSSSTFDALRDQTGASLIAPGFSYCLKGNFRSLGGVMAVSGLYIYGNVDATVKGTIINYSDEAAVIEGNPVWRFDRSSSTGVPAGFASDRMPTCDRSSYTEAI